MKTEARSMADRRKTAAENIQSARASLLVAAKELDGSGAFFAWHKVLTATTNCDEALKAIERVEQDEQRRARFEDELERAS